MACLLDQLHQCGEGGRLRNRRQEWRVREDEGGEGDAVGHKDEGEEPLSAWSDSELNNSDMTH